MRLRKNTFPLSPLGVTQSDAIFNILVIFAFFVVILLIKAKVEEGTIKKEKAEDVNKTKEVRFINNLVVEARLSFHIRWPKGPQDIDLWVRGPDDVDVGYSNTRSSKLGYLRDDTGNDDSEINYELITAQGFVPGTYTMNVHSFNLHNGKPRVPIECQIVLKKKDNTLFEIHHGTVILTEEHQEKTVIRFTLTSEEKIIEKNSKRYHSIVGKIRERSTHHTPTLEPYDQFEHNPRGTPHKQWENSRENPWKPREQKPNP